MGDTDPDTVSVFDTWVQGAGGRLHFDVMTTDQKLARQCLDGIGESNATVTVKECRFCHSEPLVMFSSEQQRQFREQGGFIITLPA